MEIWLRVNFDLPSFALGFLAATLFLWLIVRIRKWLPSITQPIHRRYKQFQQKNFINVDIILRQDVIMRAQKNHLSAGLFSLDEILIPPRLLVPPEIIRIEDLAASKTITSCAIPFYPEWTEITSQYPFPSIKPIQAIQNNANLLIYGQLGSGKTIALAHLACQLARRDELAGAKRESFPFYLHVNDFSPPVPASEDPLIDLIDATIKWYPRLIRNRIPNFYKELSQSGHLMLILDGLDEVPKKELEDYIHFIRSILQKHPLIQVVVACSPFNFDGLLQLGFIPMALASWSRQDRVSFIELWGKNWSKSILPDVKINQHTIDLDTTVLSQLVEENILTLSPLEWTLRLWALYAGDLQGATTLNAFEAYIQRSSSEISPNALQGLALEFLINQVSGMARAAAEEILRKSYSSETSRKSQNQSTGSSINPSSKTKGTLTKSSGNVIDRLLSTGLIIQNRNEVISFSHSSFIGFIASQSSQELTIDENEFSQDCSIWTITDCYQHYLAVQNRGISFIEKSLSLPQAPLYSYLHRISRWIKDVPLDATWRTQVMRQLVQLIQRDGLPLNLRAAFISALIYTNDPGVSILLRQLLTSASPQVRQLAAIGSGAMQDEKALDSLLTLLSDSFSEVQINAALAIGILASSTAFKITEELLKSGNESLSQAGAECLAADPILGYPILRSASESDQILVRRASVIGLGSIHEPWAQLIIERLAIKDGQWVVRNIAGQTLENTTKQNPFIPSPIVKEHASPWLLTFASKIDKGIPVGKPATEILIQALNSGVYEQQIAALGYLRGIYDKDALSAVIDATQGGEPDINQIALNTLWYYSRSSIFISS